MADDRHSAERGPAEEGGIRLRVFVAGQPEDMGEERVFDQDVVILGREEDCDLVLDDSLVSRRHAEVRRTPDGDGCVLIDLGSANGVWVNDARVDEHRLTAGERFRVGKTWVEFVACGTRSAVDGAVDGAAEVTPEPTSEPTSEPVSPPEPEPASNSEPEPESELEEKPDPEPQPTATIMGASPLNLAQIFQQEGEAVPAGSNNPFVLIGKSNAWLVETGKVEVFTVPLEDGKAKGARSHFVTVEPGQLMFGMDVDRFDMGAGFLAVGAMGTMLRKLDVSRLQELAADATLADEIAERVDTWVAGLSRRLTREIIPGPVVEVVLDAGTSTELDNHQTARSTKGVLWIEAQAGNLLFISMEELLFAEESAEKAPADRSPAQHSMVIKLDELLAMAQKSLDKRQPLFPISPDTWIEASNARDLTTTVVSHQAQTQVAGDQLWLGLALFHEVLCQCEFINKKLAAVDEYHRLQSKAEHSQAAEDAAYREIAMVLEQPSGDAVSPIAAGDEDPVFVACKMVGEAIGLKVVQHPEADRNAPYEDRVAAVAKASRFRTRVIALRDDWWRHDQGPLLARIDETDDPIALIPQGPSKYTCINPQTGEAKKVTAELAATLSPFGFTFYPPLPDGPVSAFSMVKLGARGLRGDVWMLVAMGVALGLLGTMTPFFTGKLFDSAIPEAERGLLLQFTIALFVAAVVSSAFKITQSIGVLRIQGKLDYRLQAAVWDRLLDLPSTFFRDYSSGDLADRAGGINEIRDLVAGAGISSILGSLSSIFYVALMFKYDTKMAMLAMLLTGIFVAFTFVANFLQLRHQRAKLELQGKITGLVLQLVSGVGKLRVSGAENHAFRIWSKLYAAQRRIEFTIGRIQNAVEVFNVGFPVMASMAIFYMLITLMQASKEAGGEMSMTTGDFIAFNAAYGAFQAAMQSLSQASLDILRVVPVYERLEPIVTTPAEIDETKAYPGRLKGGIEISHVSFRYSEDSPLILNDFSLVIEPGDLVAFVGGSGCGKSTLMRMMLGFEMPEKGSVYYDGQDLASLDLREVRQQIGVVLQNSQLLPAEIYRNIIGTSSLTIDDAWDAARLAGLDEDIEEMPMGMHTYVSEGGGGLSGGQRQRLLIARSLVRKPRVLFFDEATSALDNRSQATVTQSMERLQATRIVIAHRLSTIINADRICYLEGGKIAEMGTYEELMERDGLFALLAKRQMA